MGRGVTKFLSSRSNLTRIFDEEEDSVTNRKPVFANVNDMKDRLRQHLSKKYYNVFDQYKTTGMWQAIARHAFFENFTLLVISVSAFWIAFDTDTNPAVILYQAPALYQVVEHLFCSYFTLELLIRFMAFRSKWSCFRDPWFCFDLLLVIVTVSETWVMTLVALLTDAQTMGLGNPGVLRVLRLIRLARMARVARLLRAMPQLMILVKGMISAVQPVFFTLVLLCVVLYIFGTSFCQLLRGTDVGRQFFGSVLEAMHTLWIRGALLDEVSELALALQQESVVYVLLFDLFLLIATLTVMNMLIGVLCEVVSAVAAAENEDLKLHYASSKLRKIFASVMDEEDSSISKEEFVKIIDNNEATRIMHEISVDVVSLVDFADVLFAKDFDDDDYQKELSFHEIMEVIMAFRGSNTATVKDIENLRKLVCQSIAKCEFRIQRLESTLDRGRRPSLRISSVARADSSTDLGICSPLEEDSATL